jgi:hypothetical protein
MRSIGIFGRIKTLEMRSLLFVAGWSLISVCCHAQGVAENPMFNTFKQGVLKDDGNCNCVAVVKSAIGTFGVNNVFRYVATDNASAKYTVRLRNEQTIILTFAELEEAKSISGFSEKAKDLLSADIRKYALFCFAVMAKRLQLSNPAYSYKTAIADINDGYELHATAALLGLQLKPLKPCSFENLSTYNHIIILNSYYTAYANTGYYDETNVPSGYAPLNDFKQYHSGSGCMFKRCNISEAFRIDE